MPQKKPFDLRIADFLLRNLRNYKKKRQNKIEATNEKVWFHKFNKSPFLLHTLANDIQIKLYKDSILSRMIYEGFEESEIVFLHKVLKKGDYFFDVGANIGLFSLYAAPLVGKEGKVWAFEPAPSTFARLKDNMALNNFCQVEAINIGLSDSGGEKYLYISENGRDGWNTFAEGYANLFTAGMQVHVDSLENFIEKNNIDTAKIKLFKIDVEGWEVPVITGMEKILMQNPEIIMLIEFNQKNSLAAGYNCYQLYDLVSAMGFELFSYDWQKNMLFPEKKRLEYPYMNLIATGNAEKLSKHIPVYKA